MFRIAVIAFISLFYFSISHASTIVEIKCEMGGKTNITFVDTAIKQQSFPELNMDDATVIFTANTIAIKDQTTVIIFNKNTGQVAQNGKTIPNVKCEYSNLEAIESANSSPPVLSPNLDKFEDQLAVLRGRLDRIETALATGNLPDFTMQGAIPCNVDVVSDELIRFGFASHKTTEDSILSLDYGKVKVGIDMNVVGENLNFTKQFNVNMVKSGDKLEGSNNWDNMKVSLENMQKLGQFPSASCKLIGAAQWTE